MAIQFQIPKGNDPKTAQTLAKGFGLPLVQSAIIDLNVVAPPADAHTDSLYGTPVFDSLFIEKPSYSLREYDEVLKKYVDTPIVLTDNKTMGDKVGLYVEGVIIEASRSRNIITTNVSGYEKGSIVEYIGNGDWNITIRGFLSTQYPDVAPKQDAMTLLSYCDAPVPLKVVSTYLNDVIGVETIVVLQPRVFQQQGLRNVQYFELSCISNYPYQITKSNV